MLSSIFHDLRYSVRALIKHRNFTAAALFTLALGLGINTGIFTLLYSVAFRPLPVENPERVVNLYQILEGEFSRQVEGNVALLSYPEYLNYRGRVAGVSGLAASSDVKLYLGGNNVERVNGLMVTDNYFSVLRGRSSLGRTFFDKECQTPLQCPVAVLSHSFWQRRFGSDPNVVGTALSLNRQRFTVVGVTAQDFRGAEMTVPDVWIPVTMQPAVTPENKFLENTDVSWLSVVGRLKDGSSLQQVQAEMQLVAAQMDHQNPGRKTTVNVMPGSYLNSPEVRSEGTPVAILVLAAVGLVLLIACANVSNLMLARAGARRKEIAVRLALGASRWRLIRLLLTESLLLAFLGGVAGLMLTIVLPRILFSVIPEIGLDVDFQPNLTIFAYMFAISMITGVLFGLAPAIQSTKPDLTDALRSTTSKSRVARPRHRNLLVIGQVAVSLVLLIGAGLLVRGLQKAQSSDLGFNEKNLLVLSMDLTTQGYDEARAATLYAQLFERLKQVPPIKSVSVAAVAPFSGEYETTIDLGESSAGGSSVSLGANLVSPEYFQTLGIPLRRGRQFTEDDVSSGQSLAVISEAMAHRFWPGTDPINKRFKDNAGTTHTVIGIAADISGRQVGQLDGPLFYAPVAPDKLTGKSFVLRTSETSPGAVVIMKLMSSLLVGVGPTDVLTFVAVSVGALAVALLACYVPARRATKVDPLVALRND